ncbi:4'-phosphopantetheinyl transferase superfamily protein [Streptomyces sp. NPDC097619]|uniref:4'-phosphopantetheinyl transferase family protein n=1 Tax=Streptomyces sp. NPDC097619 TaxID=3157228 RepID=UPI003326BAEF
MVTQELDGERPVTGSLPVGGSVELWRLDTDRRAVGGHPVDTALLDDEERARAGRFVRPRDRQRYLAAHVGLRVLLGGYLRLPPEDVVLVREDCPGCGGPHGRPTLGGPGAGRLYFSLSHSADVALMAFSGVRVGVDIEAVPGASVVTDLINTLHPRETAELMALPEAERPGGLGRVWSRKEACLKGTGAGIGAGLVEPYVGAGPAPAGTPGWTVRDVPAPPGFAAALAVAAPAA